jgi:hypothetical protein
MEFTAGVLLDGGTIVGTREIAYRYRRHEASATTQFIATGYRFREEMHFHRQLAKLAAERGWKRAAYIAHAMPLVRANILYTSLQDALNGRWSDERKKLSILVGADA